MAQEDTDKARRDQAARTEQQRIDTEKQNAAEAERRRLLDEVRRKNQERKNG